MSSARLIIVIVVVVGVVIALFALFGTKLDGLFGSSSSTAPETRNTTTQTGNNKPATGPTQPPISKPVPVEITSFRGTVVSSESNVLTVKVGSSNQTFNIASTKDVQKLTSGSVEGGDAKTAAASTSDLKAGQEVMVIADKNSSSASSIYILK